MTLRHLRIKAIDRTPVFWPEMKVMGTVTRVARDGSWADMIWSQGSYVSWRKRQSLDRLAEWQHG
jgi:hypothetical protein